MCWFLSCLTLLFWRWRRYIPTIRRALSELPEHGALPSILSGAVRSGITPRFGKCTTLALRGFRVQNSAWKPAIPRFYLVLLQSLRENTGIIPKIRPRPLPSLQYITLSFEAAQTTFIPLGEKAQVSCSPVRLFSDRARSISAILCLKC
jgi:hypothetical protein